MVAGIYLAPIYFMDANHAKTRPILLIKQNNYQDYVFVPLTTNLQAIGIAIDNSNLQEGFLPKKSMIVYEKVSVIAPSRLIKKIGVLNAATYQMVIHELVLFLSK